VYAMGGKPIMALAILGMPIGKIATETVREILKGGSAVCASAGIPVAGGHSIDCPEPVFGLAVNGMVDLKNLKKNSTAVAGCRLYLTKALGVGILSTAQKRGILKPEHAAIALQSMCKLNKPGEALGQVPEVKAMTDVTGFGLLGHLTEMCEGSNLQAVIEFDKVPKIIGIDEYLDQGCIPGGTNRNWQSYGHKIGPVSERQKNILADPQTSGGLLVAVDPFDIPAFELVLKNNGVDQMNIHPIGWLQDKIESPVIKVI